MIYASEHYSTAMLEKLVHGSGQLPPNQHFIEITIPNGATYEMLDTAALPDWHAEAAISSKAYRPKLAAGETVTAPYRPECRRSHREELPSQSRPC